MSDELDPEISALLGGGGAKVTAPADDSVDDLLEDVETLDDEESNDGDEGFGNLFGATPKKAAQPAPRSGSRTIHDVDLLLLLKNL